jgi:hypothetical protein
MRTAISLLLLFVSTAMAQQPTLHGLWVWKTPTILDLPARGEAYATSADLNKSTKSIFRSPPRTAVQQNSRKYRS